MKTFVLGLIFLGFTNLMHSQNEMAYVKVDIEKSFKSNNNLMINANYFNALDSKIRSKRIRKFQNIVANYDVKLSDVYISELKSNYTVVFEEGENQIKAEYNQDGQIVKCSEQFKNIRLPYAISSDIAKNYPGWKFEEVICNVNYDKDNNQQVIYKVSIQKDNRRKTVKINVNDFSL